MKKFSGRLIFSLLLVLAVMALSPQTAQADPFTVDVFVITPTGPTTIPCGTLATFNIIISGRGASQWPGSPVDGTNAGLSVFDTLTNNSFVGLGNFNFASAITVLQDDNWILRQSFTVECSMSPECHLIGHGENGAFDVTLDSNMAVMKGQLAALTPLSATVVKESNTVKVTCETPEPTSMFLLGTGLAGVAIKTRKRLRNRKNK
jgi:hypothetical protein